MTGWFRIRIMCQSGVTCLPVECCFSGFKNVFNLDPTMYISNWQYLIYRLGLNLATVCHLQTGNRTHLKIQGISRLHR
jgi:hypothetical protein